MIFSCNILFGQHTHCCMSQYHYFGDEDKSFENCFLYPLQHYGLSFTTISFVHVDDDPTTTGQRWTKSKKCFENFLLAMDIDDHTRKRAQIILSCSSSRLRRRALREPTITLKGLLDLGCAMELSETQPSGIESQSSSPFDEVNYTRASQRPPVREPISRSSTCGHCGNAYPQPQGQLSCPAHGAECRACGKLNNFARVCPSKPILTSSSDRRPPPRHSLSRETPPCTNPVNSRSQRRIRHVDSQQVPSSDSDDEYISIYIGYFASS